MPCFLPSVLSNFKSLRLNSWFLEHLNFWLTTVYGLYMVYWPLWFAILICISKDLSFHHLLADLLPQPDRPKHREVRLSNAGESSIAAESRLEVWHFAASCTPGKMNECPLKRNYFKGKYIFQPLILRGYANFLGSIIYVSGGRDLVTFHDTVWLVGILLKASLPIEMGIVVWLNPQVNPKQRRIAQENTPGKFDKSSLKFMMVGFFGPFLLGIAYF